MFSLSLFLSLSLSHTHNRQLRKICLVHVHRDLLHPLQTQTTRMSESHTVPTHPHLVHVSRNLLLLDHPLRIQVCMRVQQAAAIARALESDDRAVGNLVGAGCAVQLVALWEERVSNDSA